MSMKTDSSESLVKKSIKTLTFFAEFQIISSTFCTFSNRRVANRSQFVSVKVFLDSVVEFTFAMVDR